MIEGTLDFVDCGELSVSFTCVCGANMICEGFQTRTMTDIEQEPGWCLWGFKEGQDKFFLKESEKIFCGYCNKVFELQRDIKLKEL